MLSRALSLATVMLLIGCFAAAQAQAENLEAGKSPSQIFAGTCTACHKSPRGLLRKVPAGSLPGFLRQHYTTSGEMAAVLSAYLISNGAADHAFPAASPSPARMPKPGTELRRTRRNQGFADRPTAGAAGGWRGRERRRTPPNRMARLRLRRQASAARTAADCRLPAGPVAKNRPKRMPPRPIRCQDRHLQDGRAKTERQDGRVQD